MKNSATKWAGLLAVATLCAACGGSGESPEAATAAGAEADGTAAAVAAPAPIAIFVASSLLVASAWWEGGAVAKS